MRIIPFIAALGEAPAPPAPSRKNGNGAAENVGTGGKVGVVAGILEEQTLVVQRAEQQSKSMLQTPPRLAQPLEAFG
jgi:hypothetical protein